MTDRAHVLQVGDVVVSKFRNRWTCEARERLSDGEWVYVLRNRPEEAPQSAGTVFSGALPEWTSHVERNGLHIWYRPTPRCQCPAYANAKGPYPSGFCPDCGRWYPGKSPERQASND